MRTLKRIGYLLLILFLFSSLTKTIRDYVQNISFYDSYKAEYLKEEQENKKLKAQIIKNADLYEVEKIVRNDLNLKREHEITVLLPIPTVIIPSPSPTNVPNWQQWRDTFFSSN